MNIFLRKKGFTLVETLVAVSVLLIAVAAVFTAAQSGLSATSMLRNRITAAYLGEEAVNGVKNLKDGNLLKIFGGQGIGWLDDISGCSSGSPCGYDVLADGNYGELGSCSSMDSCKVKMGTFNGGSTAVYRQMSSSLNSPDTVETEFVREIWIENTMPGKEARLVVEITRPGTSFTPYRIETFIYNFWPGL